jgi:iron complex transport system ATP-binding protein
VRPGRLLGGPDTAPVLTPSGSVALSVEAVHLDIDGVKIVEDISISAYAGEVLALVGPNGAGKSSLLSIMSGDRAPTRGSVRLHDRPLTAWSHLELALRRSVLLQQTTVAFSYPVRDVVAMGRAPWTHTTGPDDDSELVQAALLASDTFELADRLVTSLSGGELARVAFARVLAQSTGIMLLDEPTASLDLRHQELLMTLVRERAGAGAAVVVVLHDLNLAAAHVDRVAVLAQGRLVALGRPMEVLTAPRLSQVYGHPIDVLRHPRTGVPLVLPRR